MSLTRRSFVKKSSYSAAAVTVLGTGVGLAIQFTSNLPQNGGGGGGYHMTPKRQVIQKPIVDKFILSVERNRPGQPVTALITFHHNNYYYDDQQSRYIPRTHVARDEVDGIDAYIVVFRLADLEDFHDANNSVQMGNLQNGYQNENPAWPPAELREREKTSILLPTTVVNPLPPSGDLETFSIVNGQDDIFSGVSQNTIDDLGEREAEIAQLGGNGASVVIGIIKTSVANIAVAGGVIDFEVK